MIEVDRFVASSTGMAAALYTLAAFVLWYRLLFGKREPGPADPMALNGTRVIADRAVAWSAFALLFIGITSARLRWLDWHELRWVYIVSTLAITTAGLFSVHEISKRRGRAPLIVFIAVILTAGVVIWLWG